MGKTIVICATAIIVTATITTTGWNIWADYAHKQWVARFEDERLIRDILEEGEHQVAMEAAFARMK